jgi:hypothetical protein
MSDFEPVQIDFIYGGNTETEGKKIGQSLGTIADASKKAQADVTKAAAAQATVIKQIEADIKGLESRLSKAAPGNAKMMLTQELNAAKRALDEEKAALNEVNASIEQTAQKHTRLRTQVMEAKEALARLEMQGKRNTPEYNAMAAELGRLNDQMGDTAAQARILADDQKGFRAVASGVSGMAGALSAATGAAALFGAENEELTRIQTRLQAVMAISIGIQQVSETLNKDSYFSVVLLTKAKNMWAAANLKVATTLGITAAASKALMMTGIGVLIVGVVALVSWFDKYNKKLEETNKAEKEKAEFQAELKKQIADGYAKEQASISAMRSSLNSENVSRNSKLEIIKKLKEQIPGYTAELDNEGNVIRENKKAIDEYMKSLEKSLRLRAAEKEMEAIYAKRFELEKLVVPDEQPGGKFAVKSSTMTPEQKFKKQISDGAKAGIAELDAQLQKVKQRIESGGLFDAGKGASVKETVAKEVYDAEAAITDLILNIRAKRVKLEIDQQTDSLQKRLNAIRLERDEEIRAIDGKEKDIVDAYNKNKKGEKGFVAKTSLSQIDPQLAEQLAKEKSRISNTYQQKEVTETEKYQQEISDIVFKYADERTQIAYNYNKDIAEARKRGLNAWADEMEAEKQARISSVSKSLIEESELYKVAADDKLQISEEMTRRLIADIQRRVDAEVAAGKMTVDDANKIMAEVRKARNQLNTDGQNPFANLRNAISNNTTAGNAYKQALSDPTKTTAELAKLESEAKKAASSVAATSAAALQGVQAILQETFGALDQLGLLTEEEKKDADNIIGMVGGAANIAMGIATGNPMAIIQGSIQLLTNAFQYFDFKAKEIAKRQKEAKQNLDDLTRAYEKLQRAVDKALGTDIYSAQRAQIANLQKQIAEYYTLIEQERKKKKKKQDEEQIKEWQDEIEKLKAQTGDITSAIAESLAQTNVKDLASQLSDALVSAFQSGEKAAMAMGNVVNDVIKNAVINALKLKILDKMLAPAIDQFAADVESGGELTGSEADKFRNTVTAAGEAYFKALNEANTALGGIFTNSSTAAGIKGDVAKMTEETGSALVGQITAMRLNIVAMLANNKDGIDIMARQLAALEEIRTNTRRLDRIDETLYYIKLNGVKVQ